MRNPKAIVAFAHDAVVAAASVGVALYLRLDDSFFALDPFPTLIMSFAFAAIAVATFHLFGMYRGVWRYASTVDLLNIAKATTVAILVFLSLTMFLDRPDLIPRSVPFIQWCLLIVALGGSRFAYRLLRDQGLLSPGGGAPAVPVLLVGAGNAAEQFIRASRADPHVPYRVVGVLDDDRELRGRHIHGTAVLGGLGALPAIVARLTERGIRVQRLILSDPALIDPAARQRLFEQAAELGLSVARLPRLAELQDAEDGRIRPQPVALEDLLGRPQFAHDHATVEALIGGRRVLITGAGGTIGSELARQIAALHPAQLILADSSEFNLYAIDLELSERHADVPVRSILCDVRDRGRVMAIFAAERPELVFHAAALKHVPMVELNPSEGVLTNVVGTRNVADAAAHHGALAMVQVSTDKAVKPTSVMGATKRLAEFYCQALDLEGDNHGARFMTVRFGNVLGSSGSVVPLFQRQLARGGPLTVTHPEIRRYFMSVQEAVALVLQASAHGLEHTEARGQIFVLDMGKPAKIVDVAHQVIRLAGLRPDVDVKIEFTGLRPGEKLYEELFDEAEERRVGAVAGILVASSKSINLEVLRRLFEELAIASLQQDHQTLLRLLAHAVPSYRAPDAGAAEERPEGQAQPLWGYGSNPRILAEQS